MDRYLGSSRVPGPSRPVLSRRLPIPPIPALRKPPAPLLDDETALQSAHHPSSDDSLSPAAASAAPPPTANDHLSSPPAAAPPTTTTTTTPPPRRGRPPKKAAEEVQLILNKRQADEEQTRLRHQQAVLQGQPQATETVFIGEVPGFGWSEGFLPQFRTEQRPIEPIKKRRGRKKKSELLQLASGSGTAGDGSSSGPTPPGLSSRDDDAEQAPEELELFLIEMGIPKSKVQSLMDAAVAWRVTPGGRPLIDRRRQSRLARNVRIVADYLQSECGVPFGADGVGAVFLQVPELMLCKPTSNDRWDRRAVELAAYRLKEGHCNVPENWPPNVELGTWVKRQRVARAAGQLSEERLQILERMGFEFGDLAQITEEWEYRFDQLIDWMLWHGENGQAFSWVGVDWGARGGITARELALWMALQREFKRRQLLPAEAEQRFEALQVDWGTEAAGTRDAVSLEAWMGWLGRLLYVVERRCMDTKRPPVKMFGKRVQHHHDDGGGGSGSGDEDDGDEREQQRTGTASTPSSSQAAAAAGGGGSLGVSGSSAPATVTATTGRAMKARIAAITAARRESLVNGGIPIEAPGLCFWIAKQRWRWRNGRLPSEQTRMLHMAGVDMDVYRPTEWQSLAHSAAEMLQGSCIVFGESRSAANVQQSSPTQSPTPSPAALEEHNASLDGTNSSTANHASSHQEQDQDPLSLLTWRCAPGNPRLRVRRWVQTQRALFIEGRLSPNQLRYLQFLGISWILSDQVMAMQDEPWNACYEEWQGGGGGTEATEWSSRVQEWLEHQKGLRRLGLLPGDRVAALQAGGIVWEFAREDGADAWDLRLGQLLVQSISEGTLDISVENERFEGLAAWLAACKSKAVVGGVGAGRLAQLKALGVGF